MAWHGHILSCIFAVQWGLYCLVKQRHIPQLSSALTLWVLHVLTCLQSTKIMLRVLVHAAYICASIVWEVSADVDVHIVMHEYMLS